MTFYYTHSNDDVDSSAVYEVYFNQTNGNLLVVLSSGNAYEYTGASMADFDSLSEGNSPGSYFATRIKRNLGPGKSLGYFVDGDVEPLSSADEVAVAKVPAAAVGTPKGLTYAPTAKVSNEDFRLTLGVGTDESKNAVSRKHLVVFTIDGITRRSFSVNAYDVDEAVAELHKATKALGLEANVREVTVYFE